MCDGAECAFRKRSQPSTTNDKLPMHFSTCCVYGNVIWLKSTSKSGYPDSPATITSKRR